MLLRDYFEVKKRLQIQYDFLMKGSKVNDFFTLTQMLKKINKSINENNEAFQKNYPEVFNKTQSLLKNEELNKLLFYEVGSLLHNTSTNEIYCITKFIERGVMLKNINTEDHIVAYTVIGPEKVPYSKNISLNKQRIVRFKANNFEYCIIPLTIEYD